MIVLLMLRRPSYVTIIITIAKMAMQYYDPLTMATFLPLIRLLVLRLLCCCFRHVFFLKELGESSRGERERSDASEFS